MALYMFIYLFVARGGGGRIRSNWNRRIFCFNLKSDNKLRKQAIFSFCDMIIWLRFWLWFLAVAAVLLPFLHIYILFCVHTYKSNHSTGELWKSLMKAAASIYHKRPHPPLPFYLNIFLLNQHRKAK